MRGEISDQDLTDYALNELDPRERLYVESMLAVSEECRNDVYENIELALMLEEGFEREDAQVPALLTIEQRQRVLRGEFSVRRYLRPAAAALAAAACVAFLVSRPAVWKFGTSREKVAEVSTQVSDYVVDAVTSSPASDDFVNQVARFRTLSEDPALMHWLGTDFIGPVAPGSAPAAIWEAAPHATLEIAP